MRIMQRDDTERLHLRSGNPLLVVLSTIFGSLGVVLGVVLGLLLMGADEAGARLLLLLPGAFLLTSVILLARRKTIRADLRSRGTIRVRYRRIFGLSSTEEVVDSADGVNLRLDSHVDMGASSDSTPQRISTLCLILEDGDEIVLGIDRRRSRPGSLREPQLQALRTAEFLGIPLENMEPAGGVEPRESADPVMGAEQPPPAGGLRLQHWNLSLMWVALVFMVLAVIPFWELFITRGAWDQPWLFLIPAVPLLFAAVVMLFARMRLIFGFDGKHITARRWMFMVPGRRQQFEHTNIHHIEVRRAELVGLIRIAGILGFHHYTVLLHMREGAPAALTELKGVGRGGKAVQQAEQIAQFIGRPLEHTEDGSAPEPVRRIVERL